MRDIEIDLVLLSSRLKEARLGLRLTGKQVAERCGISEEYYRQVEGGFQSPSLKLLNILCVVLERSPDYLLGYTDALAAKDAALKNILPPYQALVKDIEDLLIARLPKKDGYKK